MEILPLANDTVRKKFLSEAKSEVLIFAPNLKQCAIVAKQLCDLCNSGVNVQILTTTHSDPIHSLLENSGVKIHTLKNSIFRSSHEPHIEIWVSDKKAALIEHPLFNETRAFLLTGSEVQVISEYFLKFWGTFRLFRHQLSYFTRQKKFSFRMGKGSLDDLYSEMLRAESEIVAVIPKVSKRLLNILIQARQKNIRIILYTNTKPARKLSQLRWWARQRRLKQFGVQILPLVHKNFDHLVLVDRKRVNFGSFRMDFLGRKHFESSVCISDHEIGHQFYESMSSQNCNDDFMKRA